MRENGEQYTVRAVERVTDILDALQRSEQGLSLGALAELTEMPKSSVFRYLATLEARGYVARTADHHYTLGLSLPPQRQYFDLLGDRLRPLLVELRDRFGETVNLGVLDGDRLIYQEIVESRHAMRLAARRGDRDYLHSTALGKALMATLDDDEVRQIVPAAGMPARTRNTIVDIDDYLRALEQVRADGYATDDEENEEGARCVAVALRGLVVPAGVSVSAPAVRLSAAEAAKIAALLAREAPRLSRGSVDPARH
jgi:IclR family transcriptional regulator, acetate operon repressor